MSSLPLQHSHKYCTVSGVAREKWIGRYLLPAHLHTRTPRVHELTRQYSTWNQSSSSVFVKRTKTGQSVQMLCCTDLLLTDMFHEESLISSSEENVMGINYSATSEDPIEWMELLPDIQYAATATTQLNNNGKQRLSHWNIRQSVMVALPYGPRYYKNLSANCGSLRNITRSHLQLPMLVKENITRSRQGKKKEAHIVSRVYLGSTPYTLWASRVFVKFDVCWDRSVRLACWIPNE
jgi:hypothetical protein